MRLQPSSSLQWLQASRDRLQSQIDEWHGARRGKAIDRADYEAFLRGIGYLEPEGADFSITTPEVDPEAGCRAVP